MSDYPLDTPGLTNYVIVYRSWEAYNALSEDEAIEMFRRDGHKDDEILDVS